MSCDKKFQLSAPNRKLSSYPRGSSLSGCQFSQCGLVWSFIFLYTAFPPRFRLWDRDLKYGPPNDQKCRKRLDGAWWGFLYLFCFAVVGFWLGFVVGRSDRIRWNRLLPQQQHLGSRLSGVVYPALQVWAGLINCQQLMLSAEELGWMVVIWF